MSQSCVGLGQRLHTSPELGLARDILADGRSFCDTARRVTRSVGDMLFFRVMANSLTAEVRLGIAANWP